MCGGVPALLPAPDGCVWGWRCGGDGALGRRERGGGGRGMCRAPAGAPQRATPTLCVHTLSLGEGAGCLGCRHAPAVSTRIARIAGNHTAPACATPQPPHPAGRSAPAWPVAWLGVLRAGGAGGGAARARQLSGVGGSGSRPPRFPPPPAAPHTHGAGGRIYAAGDALRHAEPRLWGVCACARVWRRGGGRARARVVERQAGGASSRQLGAPALCEGALKTSPRHPLSSPPLPAHRPCWSSPKRRAAAPAAPAAAAARRQNAASSAACATATACWVSVRAGRRADGRACGIGWGACTVPGRCGGGAAYAQSLCARAGLVPPPPCTHPPTRSPAPTRRPPTHPNPAPGEICAREAATAILYRLKHSELRTQGLGALDEGQVRVRPAA